MAASAASAASASGLAAIKPCFRRNSSVKGSLHSKIEEIKTRYRGLIQEQHVKTLVKAPQLEKEAEKLRKGAKTLNQSAKAIAMIAGAVGAFVLVYILLKNKQGYDIAQVDKALDFLEANKLIIALALSGSFIACLGGRIALQKLSSKKQEKALALVKELEKNLDEAREPQRKSVRFSEKATIVYY